MWDESVEVGVGYATVEENGGTSIYVVGRYSPGGNLLNSGWSSHVNARGSNSATCDTVELCDGSTSQVVTAQPYRALESIEFAGKRECLKL